GLPLTAIFGVLTVFDDLLELQGHDTVVDRLRHRLDALPERAELLAREATVADVDRQLAELSPKQGDVGGRQKRLEDELAAEEEAAREKSAAALPPQLLNLYESLRKKLGGVGAARLEAGACGGCHMRLPATELDAIKHQAPEVIVRCDQCGRILVR